MDQKLALNRKELLIKLAKDIKDHGAAIKLINASDYNVVFLYYVEQIYAINQDQSELIEKAVDFRTNIAQQQQPQRQQPLGQQPQEEEKQPHSNPSAIDPFFTSLSNKIEEDRKEVQKLEDSLKHLTAFNKNKYGSNEEGLMQGSVQEIAQVPV